MFCSLCRGRDEFATGLYGGKLVDSVLARDQSNLFPNAKTVHTANT